MHGKRCLVYRSVYLYLSAPFYRGKKYNLRLEITNNGYINLFKNSCVIDTAIFFKIIRENYFLVILNLLYKPGYL